LRSRYLDAVEDGIAMTAPLHGIKVLDVTRVLAGPWCTMTLADLGAEVWKIENPAGGDDTRSWTPPSVEGISTYFLAANRNKKSVAVDLKTAQGRAIVAELAAKADVLVENLRPSSLRSAGLAYEQLSAINPRLIHCSISGYGRDGPFAERAGYDFVMQAETGFMSITGEIAGEPMRLGVAFVDLAAGSNAAQAILAALYARERTGTGQSIDIALFDSALHFLANIASGYLNTGIGPTRFGNAHASIVPYQLFDTADGCIALAVGNDQQYRRLCCDVLGCDGLWTDARFRTNAARTRNREQLIPRLAAELGRHATAVLLSKLRQHGIPAGTVRSVADAFASQEALARDVVVTAAHPRLDQVRMVRSPLRLSGSPTVAAIAPPGLGQHTSEVLASVLGYSAAQIAALERQGAVACGDAPVTSR
jgi:crotonobetainyl-CoA:carnitine CoA-transferase CaiB-like acyl-CoA transferase